MTVLIFTILVFALAFWIINLDGLNRISKFLGYNHGFPLVMVDKFDKTVNTVMLKLLKKLRNDPVFHLERTDYYTLVIFEDGTLFRYWTANGMFACGISGQAMQLDSNVFEKLKAESKGKTLDEVLSLAVHMDEQYNDTKKPSWYIESVKLPEEKFTWRDIRASRKTNDLVETAVQTVAARMNIDLRTPSEIEKTTNDRIKQQGLKKVLGE